MKWKTITVVAGLALATLGSVALAPPGTADPISQHAKGDSDSFATRHAEHRDEGFMANRVDMDPMGITATHDQMQEMMGRHDITSSLDHSDCPTPGSMMSEMMPGMEQSGGPMMSGMMPGMGRSDGPMMDPGMGGSSGSSRMPTP
jgi:hypothetical protein